MKAIRIHRFGGPEALQPDDVPIPRPGEGELLMRIHAASVNPVDYKIRRGTVPWVSHEMLPMTLGRDLSGTVESAGAGVDAFSRGDALYARLDSIDRGSYAEYVLVKPNEAAPKPARLSHIEAAAVPLAALTAWQGLFGHGHLEAGQTVLIHGGSGGVGHFAIQFAKVKGATVFTTVSAQNLDFVGELGADCGINYESQRFEEIARDVDLVLDVVGGKTRERSWSVLAGRRSRLRARRALERKGDAAWSAWCRLQSPSQWRTARRIGRLIDQGKVRPVVMATYPLAEARQAHERLERGHLRGKIVLVVTE